MATREKSFPEFIGRANTPRTSQQTSHVVNLPSGIQAGDILVAIYAATNPANWTNLQGFSDMGGEMGTLYKVATGSEGSTVTLVGSSSVRTSWQVLLIRGGALPVEREVTNGTNSINPPSLSPSWGQAKTLWIASAINSGASFSITAAPASYSEFSANIFSSGGTSLGLASAIRQREAASENPGSFTGTEDGYTRAATFAIQPA